MLKKKKILFLSNNCKAFTGFGRHAKALLKYLYLTGKYEIVELSTGTQHSHPDLKTLPWKAYGTLPDTNEEWQQILAGLNEHDQAMKQREVNYGSYHVDTVIKREKPDVFIGTEDIWAFKGFYDKAWWNKINCIIHTTLDSLPILPDAIDAADKIKHYYVWAKFAEEAMNEIGHKHVKTLHGAIESDDFFKLEDEKKLELRKRFNIPENSFVVGFVFRNQLRKSVVSLLKGFKSFLDKNPDSNALLLLHTHWAEPAGWNIPQRIKEIGLDPNRVITTYICKETKNYYVMPYQLPEEEWNRRSKTRPEFGQNIRSPFTGNPCMVTCNVSDGISEPQLNEIYNLMDVYCHPFTSGGQEIPIQEAKLTELITLVTDYSCGTEYCTKESGGLPLDWEEYREPGTEFVKAATKNSDITKKLEYVYKLPKHKKESIGKIARDFVLEECDIKVVGKKMEEILDSLPYIIDNGGK